MAVILQLRLAGSRLPSQRFRRLMPTQYSVSIHPRRNLPERPEYWAFPLIKGDRHTDFGAEIDNHR